MMCASQTTLFYFLFAVQTKFYVCFAYLIICLKDQCCLHSLIIVASYIEHLVSLLVDLVELSFPEFLPAGQMLIDEIGVNASNLSGT